MWHSMQVAAPQLVIAMAVRRLSHGTAHCMYPRLYCAAATSQLHGAVQPEGHGVGPCCVLTAFAVTGYPIDNKAHMCTATYTVRWGLACARWPLATHHVCSQCACCCSIRALVCYALCHSLLLFAAFLSFAVTILYCACLPSAWHRRFLWMLSLYPSVVLDGCTCCSDFFSVPQCLSSGEG